jgi:uncharacterized protein YraI
MRRPGFWLVSFVVCLLLSVTAAFAQELPRSGVPVVVNRDGVNVRLLPALGAEVLGNVNARTTFDALARSPDSEWVKVLFNGEEGWVGTVVLTVLSGDINGLPVADPRTIPYGGWDSPRAGSTTASGPIQGSLDGNGVRVRFGPSRAYPILANAPRRTVFPILGRTYNNSWLQVNYLGFLGWVSAPEVTVLAGDINSLPVDGIVAESIPPSRATGEDFFGVLRGLRDRVELAQPSLDAMRSTWTDIALGGRPACGSFPARPSDTTIPQPLLAAYYDTLNPVLQLFNSAMTNLRSVIDLYIERCGITPPSASQATVQNALDILNTVDTQFTQLRQRFNELIPPDQPVGPDQCLFTYETAFDILSRIDQNIIYVDHITPRNTLTGYCFDANANEPLTVTLAALNGNISLFFAVSPIDNPTNFLGVQRGGLPGAPISVSFTPTTTGRYIIIVQNLLLVDASGVVQAQTAPPAGDFALLVTNPLLPLPTTASAIDLETRTPPIGLDVSPVLGQSTAPVFPTAVPIVPVVVTPGIPGQATAVPGSIVPETVFCPGLNLTCEQLTCEQARACLAAGNFNLDPDNDGIPCENLSCAGN